MKKIFLSLIIGLMLTTQAMAQVLTAKVNRSEIPEGETFLLTLDYEGGKDSSVPDLNVLDQDFVIYSVSNSYSTSYTNGVTSQMRQWQIALMPKTIGGNEVIVPAISLGSIKSNPISIKILNAAQALDPQNASASNSGYQAQSNRPRFAINGEVDNKKPYVQQQVNYTLTLYDTGGLQGSEPEFMDDGKNEWLIKSLGSPEIDSKVINGQSIREIKFHYAMFPQKSGVLKTPEIRFNGYYLSESRGGSDPFEEIFNGGLLNAGIGFNSMFATRNPVVLTTKPVDIEVKPIPSINAGKWWIPAENVKLYAEWNPANPTFRVGEAVNRSIYLKATGVSENQLPDIKFAMVEGLKQYPEKAVAQNGIEQDNVVAVKKISNVYIPNTTGNITIPEVRVDWFNVKTNQPEIAILPAVSIKVLPNTNMTQVQPEANVPTDTREERAETLIDAADATVDFMKDELPQSSNYNIYIMAIAAFVLGLVFSYLIFRPARRSSKANSEIKDYAKFVIQSAKDKDFRALRDGILCWAEDKFKDCKITSMKEVIKQVKSKDFEKQIELLSAELYSNDKTNWDSKAFIEVFEKADKKKVTAKADKNPLPKLYKD